MSDVCHECGCFECECQDSTPELHKKIYALTAQLEASRALLAERDAEIERLRQQSVGWVAVFDENAALRAEVERLKLIISGKTFVDERKLVAQEIIQYIIDQGKVAFGSLSARDYVYDIIDSDIEELRQRYGLEG